MLSLVDVQTAVALGTGIETRTGTGTGIERETATGIVEGIEIETEAGIEKEIIGTETETEETEIGTEVALPPRPLPERLTTETWLHLCMAGASMVEGIVGVGRMVEVVVEGETGKGLALGNGAEFRSSRAIHNILSPFTVQHGFYYRSV